MDINLNINAPGLCEALNNFASALLGMGSNTVATLETPASTRKPRGAKKDDAETIQEVVQAEILPESIVVEKVAEAIKAEKVITSDPVAKVFTLEQVRAKLSELSAAGKAPQIKELFGKFGAKKLTEVPEANYAELMSAAEMIS